MPSPPAAAAPSPGPPQSARLLRAFLDAVDGPGWALTTTGRVIYANGLAAQVADGDPWAEQWPEDCRIAVRNAVAAATQGRRARFRSQLRSGGQAPGFLETTVTPVAGDGGAVAHLIAVSRNITGDVEREALLGAILDQLPTCVTVRDCHSGRNVLVNRAAAQAFGPEGQAAAGAGATRSRLEAVDGEVREFEVRQVPLFDDGGQRHSIVFSQDVTDQTAREGELAQALEAATRASSAKDVFLANISHELRTPLNGIVVAAELLGGRPLAPDERELAELIRASGEALEGLLHELLSLVRIHAGDRQLEIDGFSCDEVVEAVAARFRDAASAKGLHLRIAVAPEARRPVMGDAAVVRQVLGRLVCNAVKFTDKGRVEVACEPAEPDWMRFRVADTGVGFDAAEAEQLFGEFHQADSSPTRRHGGAGVGLRICRDLVDLMGGRLACDSRPGEGAVFTCELPLPFQAACEPAAPLAGPAKLRILAADDHPTNRRVIELLLGDVAELTCVENGREAVDAFRPGLFDLVLMDVQMPVMDGLTAIRLIREQEGTAARTPIVVLTANAGPEHARASRQAGADAHMEKPLHGGRLLETVARLAAGPPGAQRGIAT